MFSNKKNHQMKWKNQHGRLLNGRKKNETVVANTSIKLDYSFELGLTRIGQASLSFYSITNIKSLICFAYDCVCMCAKKHHRIDLFPRRVYYLQHAKINRSSPKFIVFYICSLQRKLVLSACVWFYERIKVHSHSHITRTYIITPYGLWLMN